MIRKTTKREKASNPSFGPFVRVENGIIIDSGTADELKDLLRRSQTVSAVVTRLHDKLLLPS